MAATASIDAIEWLRKQVEAAPDGLRTMLTEMVNLLMSSDLEAICGASYGERSEDRVKDRPADPQAPARDLLPGWLLEPRRRAEKAFTAVGAEAYLLGVSTRKVEDLVRSLGIERLSKSQVSQLSKELDGVVKSFRERPLVGP